MRNQSYLVLAVAALVVVFLCGSLSAQTYTITTQVISNGGTFAASNGSYTLSGTLKQTVVGNTTGNYMLQHGFWPWVRGLNGCCIALRGNCDGDLLDLCDISDLAYLGDYLYNGGPAASCTLEADVDASGTVDISDYSALIDYLYISFTPPAACP